MIPFFYLLLAFNFLSAMPDPVTADIVWISQEGFCEPETILPLPDDTLLVSNVCGFSKTGTGFLTLLDMQGQILKLRVVDGLDAPLGMALRDGQIYVVDNNAIAVFAWPEFELQKTLSLTTKVANDVAVHADGTLFVTDTAAGNVVKVALDGATSLLGSEQQFPGANGIEIRENQLFVGGQRLWCVDIATQSVEVLGPEWLTDIDGIEFESSGVVQVTPVGGPLVRLLDDGVSVLGGNGVSSANHGYAPKFQLAFIPTGFDNTVIAIRVP